MRREKKAEEVDAGAPAWMVTYGDMMTLLLCFFVLLFSFSVVDAERFENVMQALKSKLGVLDGGRTLNNASMINRGLDSDDFAASKLDENEFEQIMDQVESYISRANLESEIKLAEEERGLIIRLTGQVIFDLGKADLKPNGQQVLKEISKILESIPNNIFIEGHTDNLPIVTNAYPSNWELSTLRATTVLRFITEHAKIEGKRLAASGYADTRPLAPNDTPANRALNRRVDIVITRYLPITQKVVGEGYHE